MIAGLAYELLRFSGLGRCRGCRVLAAPGLWLQKLTTNRPAADQIEVAIASMVTALDEDQLQAVLGRGAVPDSASSPARGDRRLMEEQLAARLAEVEEAFREVEAELSRSEVASDPSRLAELGKRHSELGVIVRLLGEWRRADQDRREALELAAEDPSMAPELKRLAEERAEEMERLEGEIRRAMIPKDPNDDKDVIVEIRAAAGGDEAAIWAGDLLRMYERYAESHGFKVEPMEAMPSEAGGFTRVTIAVKGRGAYSRLKYEAGVHRVQRVPKTESQGRIHTSTATVAVLPEADEVEIDPADVRVDVFSPRARAGSR